MHCKHSGPSPGMSIVSAVPVVSKSGDCPLVCSKQYLDLGYTFELL